MPATIFSGSKVKTLKDTLQIGNNAEISSGTVNPQSVATSGEPGSLYLNTSTGDVYRKLDSGSSTNWTLTGAGGGGAGVNFVGLDTAFKLTAPSDIDAEVSVGNHVAYADAAATTPVDMTGGSPGTTVARSTSSPLNGAASVLMDLGSGSSRQGEGHSLVINVPSGYRGRLLEYSFVFSTSGTLAEDDLVLSAYDVTNAELITDTITPAKVFGSTGIARLQFRTKTSTAQIRVGLHVARTSTGALSVKMDDFQVGPKLSISGLAGSNWESYSLTIDGTTTAPTKGTIVRDEARWRQVGDEMELRYDFSQSTAGTAGSGNYLFPLPPGYSIDLTKFPANRNPTFADNAIVGRGWISTTSDWSTSRGPVDVLVLNSNTLILVGGTSPGVPCALATIGLAPGSLTRVTFASHPAIGNFA